MTEAAAVGRTGDRLLDVVVEILESEGYDAVQLREVARRAKTSLATIYKRYPTREDLIVAALEYWSQRHRYSGIKVEGEGSTASLHDGLMQIFRTIFQPWESHPEMLAAYFRVRSSASGQKLFRFGLDVVGPAGLEVLAGVDDEFTEDLYAVLSSVVYGLLGRYVAGEIAVADILPILDRTVYWLTRGYELDSSKKSGTAVARRSISS